jgi:hypothetical protein
MKRMMLSVSCLVMAACMDEMAAPADEVSEVEQQACTPVRGRGCTVLHPIGWVVNGVGCAERRDGTSFLNDGQSYTAIGIPSPIYGIGQTTLSCDGGCLITVPGSTGCRKQIGRPN